MDEGSFRIILDNLQCQIVCFIPILAMNLRHKELQVNVNSTWYVSYDFETCTCAPRSESLVSIISFVVFGTMTCFMIVSGGWLVCIAECRQMLEMHTEPPHPCIHAQDTARIRNSETSIAPR